MATNISSLPDIVSDNDANHNGHHELIHKRLKELNLEVVAAAQSADWGEVIDTPATYPPEQHEHDIKEVIGLEAELDTKAEKTPSSSITVVPEYKGQIAIVGTVAYIAVGTTATTDWKQITN